MMSSLLHALARNLHSIEPTPQFGPLTDHLAGRYGPLAPLEGLASDVNRR